MELKNKVEIKFPGLDKGLYFCDSDSTWGQIYDYACHLKSLSFQKIQEQEKTKEAVQEEIIKEGE